MRRAGLWALAAFALGLSACSKKARSTSTHGGVPNDAIHRGGLEGASRSDDPHAGMDRDAPMEKLPPVIIDGKRGDAASGKRLFAQLCVTCHGEGGAGGGIMASGNLTDAAWQSARTDQQIGVVISHGKANTKMPSFADKMDLQKLNDLVAYIRTLKR